MAVAALDDEDAFVRFAARRARCPADQRTERLLGLHRSAQERGTWVEADGSRWVNTGDTARQDADGYFWLTGRKKEIIIRGGHTSTRRASRKCCTSIRPSHSPPPWAA
jgi:fatty-acyl-CoA synthase